MPPGCAPDSDRRLPRILSLAQAHFGETVHHVSAPGGTGRSSFRLLLSGGRSVIATMRDTPARARFEAQLLAHVGAHCDDTAKLLGVRRNVLFQSDVGHERLAQRIALYRRSSQVDLAARAVAAIFRYQRAAARPGLSVPLAHLGVRRDWVSRFVGQVGILQAFGLHLPPDFDRAAACAAVARPGRNFVKWDCRAGNAAIGPDNRVRWFDFEYAGLRHGAEDIAWLVADETWPVAPGVMEAIVADALPAAPREEQTAYLEYLATYVTFHAAHRIGLILREAAARGWQPKTRVRELDDAGVHPDFVMQLLRVGAHFSARARVTAPLASRFEDAARRFRDCPGIVPAPARADPAGRVGTRGRAVPPDRKG